MARLPRIAIPEFPHHVTQRGNRKGDIFLDDVDRYVYLKLLKAQCAIALVRIWAWCLMTNHVHFVVVPEYSNSLSRVFQRVHGDYAGYFNTRYGQSGHLWQGRFKGSVLDERHLWNAVRYVERNPVRAGMVKGAEDYPWSSAAGHCGLRPDHILSNDLPLLSEIPDWSAWLAERELQEDLSYIRNRTRTGRPCASDQFAKEMEMKLKRNLLPQRTGRKRTMGE